MVPQPHTDRSELLNLKSLIRLLILTALIMNFIWKKIKKHLLRVIPGRFEPNFWSVLAQTLSRRPRSKKSYFSTECQGKNKNLRCSLQAKIHIHCQRLCGKATSFSCLGLLKNVCHKICQKLGSSSWMHSEHCYDWTFTTVHCSACSKLEMLLGHFLWSKTPLRLMICILIQK